MSCTTVAPSYADPSIEVSVSIPSRFASTSSAKRGSGSRAGRSHESPIARTSSSSSVRPSDRCWRPSVTVSPNSAPPRFASQSMRKQNASIPIARDSIDDRWVL